MRYIYSKLYGQGPKSWLVQGHPDNEAKNMALKPADSKFNVSLTTTELWWTVIRAISTNLGSIPETTQPPVEVCQVLMSLWVLWLGSCSTHPTGFCCPTQSGFLNIRWNGKALQKKWVSGHIPREIQLVALRRWGWEDAWQGPKETVILGNLQGLQSGPSPPGLINSSCQSHGYDWTQSTDSF